MRSKIEGTRSEIKESWSRGQCGSGTVGLIEVKMNKKDWHIVTQLYSRISSPPDMTSPLAYWGTGAGRDTTILILPCRPASPPHI